ncbi:MAG: hypothetical protein LBJ67_03320 [Planctomycetaceae bacterium]|nr:hypothetical protein [Planctomycetaceae bacterium]
MNIANEFVSNPDVQVPFGEMSKQRRDEFVGKLNSWCETYIQEDVKDSNRCTVSLIEIGKKDLRHLFASYFYLPVFSTSPANLRALTEQKERLKIELLQRYEAKEISPRKNKFIKTLVDGLSAFYSSRTSSEVTPSMKYPLPENDFSKLLNVLFERIDGIEFDAVGARPLQAEVMAIVALIEQTYNQVIPQEVLDETRSIQAKIRKLFDEQEQKKSMEAQLADNMRRTKEFEDRFFEKVDEEIAMIAKEEQWDELGKDKVGPTPARVGFLRVMLIVIGIAFILFAFFRRQVLRK